MQRGPRIASVFTLYFHWPTGCQSQPGHIQRNPIGFVWAITPLLLVTVFVSYKENAGPNGDVICRYAIFVGEQSCSEKQD